MRLYDLLRANRAKRPRTTAPSDNLQQALRIANLHAQCSVLARLGFHDANMHLFDANARLVTQSIPDFGTRLAVAEALGSLRQGGAHGGAGGASNKPISYASASRLHMTSAATSAALASSAQRLGTLTSLPHVGTVSAASASSGSAHSAESCAYLNACSPRLPENSACATLLISSLVGVTGGGHAVEVAKGVINNVDEALAELVNLTAAECFALAATGTPAVPNIDPKHLTKLRCGCFYEYFTGEALGALAKNKRLVPISDNLAAWLAPHT